uniref:two-partner secretion domain-containing protein n=1 Tax=uncultured Thioclava sp. TaxID=473858 RepID=UPI0025EEF26A
MNNVFRLIWSRRLGTLVPVPEGLGTAGRKNRRMMRRLRRLMRKMVGPGAAALTLGMLVPLGAQALPTGGQVVAGQAAITQNGSQMTITQSSDKAILNWQGFDIGAQERVTFAQPSTSSVALNRVVGNTASAIYGGMDANGQVFLVNQNGVYFAPGAQVSAGGLLVSTLGISDSDFMAGRLNFSGDSTAGVTNDGTIRAGQGGYVAFIGRHVDNEGQIITPGGKTALGAGGAVDISLSGNALLQFRVSADALDAQVKNGGVIQAENGAVVMSAHARDALMKTVVNNTGVIEARGVRRGAGGTIELLGGDSGTVAVSGRLDASSSAGKGGKIAVRGQHVVAKSTARLDVTGAQGGGKIAFGGGLHGAGGAQAETTTVEQGALLDASATGLGDGGTIAIWSDIMRADGVTLSYGTLLAKGGAQGGDGGMIETSGHRLDVTGSTVSTKAPAGADGTWLIDPYNLTVTDSSATSASAGTNTPAGADSTILASSISTALASGTVTLQTTGTRGPQAGDTTVDAALAWSRATTLTFYTAST